jgi:glutamine synthetase
VFRNHQRIIFDGNGYSDEWKSEAAHRGLSNFPSTAECLGSYINPKNVELVTKHGIFTEAEFRARYEIHLEAYSKLINIEARTMVDMVMHQILPAALRYSSDLADSVNRKNAATGHKPLTELSLVTRISESCDRLYEASEQLYAKLKKVPQGNECAANYYSEVIVSAMQAVRKEADFLEKLTAKSYWPYPTYSDLLFY